MIIPMQSSRKVMNSTPIILYLFIIATSFITLVIGEDCSFQEFDDYFLKICKLYGRDKGSDMTLNQFGALNLPEQDIYKQLISGEETAAQIKRSSNQRGSMRDHDFNYLRGMLFERRHRTLEAQDNNSGLMKGRRFKRNIMAIAAKKDCCERNGCSNDRKKQLRRYCF